MKEVKRYKCDFCRVLRATIQGIEKHERQCIHNPESVNCFRCAYAYEGDVYSRDGYPTGKLGPVCTYTEDTIWENMAHKCERYKLSEYPYYIRRECPKIDDEEVEP